MGYDIDGSVVFARDALNHQTTISYNDAFSASARVSTRRDHLRPLLIRRR